MTKSELSVLIDQKYKEAFSELSVIDELKDYCDENGKLSPEKAINFTLFTSCKVTAKALNKVLSDVLELDDQ